MDSVKTDNEGELTSTMDNVISVPSKDEKSDTSSDATPTSSTDANIRPTASHIALDDPISSTSSDSIDQVKQKMDKREIAAVDAHRVSTDNEADLLDISNITNNEKITEDVEDLVHDLESLLGESTDSFNITSNSKFGKTDSSKGTASGVSSFDTSSPKNSAVDDVLQELEELAGNVITDNASISPEQNKETESDNTLSIESTVEGKTDNDTETNTSVANDVSLIDNSVSVETLASGSSAMATNSDLGGDDSHTNSNDNDDSEANDPEHTNNEEGTSSNSGNIQRQETPCIQDQDISHSEPKDAEIETPEITISEAPTECVEEQSSKTEEVSSSDSEPKEPSCVLDTKSLITCSEEINETEVKGATSALGEKSLAMNSEEVKNETDPKEAIDEIIPIIDSEEVNNETKEKDTTCAFDQKSPSTVSEEEKSNATPQDANCAPAEKSPLMTSEEAKCESDNVVSNAICEELDDKFSQNTADRGDDNVKTKECVELSNKNEKLSAMIVEGCEEITDGSVVDTKEATCSLTNKTKDVNIDCGNLGSMASVIEEIESTHSAKVELSEFVTIEQENVSKKIEGESGHVEIDNTDSSPLTSSTVPCVVIDEMSTDNESVSQCNEDKDMLTVASEVGTLEGRTTSKTNDNVEEILDFIGGKVCDTQSEHSKKDEITNNSNLRVENETIIQSDISAISSDESSPKTEVINDTAKNCDIDKSPEVLAPDEILHDFIKPVSDKLVLDSVENSLFMECDIGNSVMPAEILPQKQLEESDIQVNDEDFEKLSGVNEITNKIMEKQSVSVLTEVLPPSETISSPQEQSTECNENIVTENSLEGTESQISSPAIEKASEINREEAGKEINESKTYEEINLASDTDNERQLEINVHSSVSEKIVESQSAPEEVNEAASPLSLGEDKEVISEDVNLQLLKIADLPDLKEESTSKDNNKPGEMKEAVSENSKEDTNEHCESQDVGEPEITDKEGEISDGIVIKENLEVQESVIENTHFTDVVTEELASCPEELKDLSADDEHSVSDKHKIIDSTNEVEDVSEKEIELSVQDFESSKLIEQEITKAPSEMSEEDVVPTLALELDDNMDDAKVEEEKFNKIEHLEQSEKLETIDDIVEASKEEIEESSVKDVCELNELATDVTLANIECTQEESTEIIDSKVFCSEPNIEISPDDTEEKSSSEQTEVTEESLKSDNLTKASIEHADSPKEVIAEIATESLVESSPIDMLETASEETTSEKCKQTEVVVQDETALAVASLEDIEMKSDTPELTEKEKQDMEALRQAVESITDGVNENIQEIDDEEQKNLLVTAATEDSASNEITEIIAETSNIPIDLDKSSADLNETERTDASIPVDVSETTKALDDVSVMTNALEDVNETSKALEHVSETTKVLDDRDSDKSTKNKYSKVEEDRKISDKASIEIAETPETDKHIENDEKIKNPQLEATETTKEIADSAVETQQETTSAVVNEKVQEKLTKPLEPTEMSVEDAKDIGEPVVASTEDDKDIEEKLPIATPEPTEHIQVYEKDENEIDETPAEGRDLKTPEDTESSDTVSEEILPDSSMSVSDNEAVDAKEGKTKTAERSRRHKRSSDNKLEELNVNVDVSDKEKAYSPKITIKPIKVPDEEVSTTSNSEAEACKGSLKMTITKQSDKMHSILKVCDIDQSPEPAQEAEEPLPKLKIKSKPSEQSAPKMSTRSTRQAHQTVNATQRSSSPRITIKPVVKPEVLSPLKIKIGLKTDESTKKHSPKLNIKAIPKPEEEPKEMTQSPRKVLIKPVVKPPEEEEQTPKITIKPIPKPDLEKEATTASPKLNIKPIKKPEEDENDSEKTSPKITIKPIVKPPEPDSHSDEIEDDTKKRIVLKINKGNIPPKESRKREHSAEDDKAEKLAKITVKFSREGGHPHIVQQPDENPQKRPHEEPNHLEKNKKQKVEAEMPVSTKSKQKDAVEAQSETKKNNPSPEPIPENSDNPKVKPQIADNPGHGQRGKHKDSGTNSPIEAKRSKLKENRQKENPDTKKTEADVSLNIDQSPVNTTTEETVSDSQGTPQISTPLSTPGATPEIVESTPQSTPSTPNIPPPKKRRGRPRKIRPEEQLDTSTDTPPPKEVQTPPAVSAGSGRPKRSCRGQSALDTLGLKPRKPRGSRGGGRGGGRVASGESRAILMKPEKEPKLSQARLKLFQKAIAEAGTINVVSIGIGDDKSVDIEDVLPQSQVEKKITDVGGNIGCIIPKTEGVVKGEALFGLEGGKNVTSQTGGVEDTKNPNTKTNLVYPSSSTSTEVGVPSSSTSPPQDNSEAMLVSDPVPHDASLPKSFGAGDDSSLLVPESSTTIHSAVSSTTGPSEIVMVDEETRMSADISSRAQTPAKQVVPMDIVEESQSSVQSSATTESGKASSSRTSKAPRLEVQEPEGSVISADQLAEYYWNGNGPFMLQEQVAQFLGIKSFKRKYPGIKRRMLEMQERDFIRESGIVSENMCDLGLTAVNSADILDIMYSDFQDKYEEYCKHQRDRQTKELINKQRALSLAASQEKSKADLTENAKQSAAQWNANFNKVRREQRRACMDLQTYTIHYPKGRVKQCSKGKMGNYPVSLVPGQFTDYYKEFTPTEINNLPLNTMCYEPIDYIRPEVSSDSGSDGSDSDSDSSSSSSDSDSSSSSGVEDCKLCKHSPKKISTTAISK